MVLSATRRSIRRQSSRHHVVAEQLSFAREKVKRLGLEDLVTLELKDYMLAEGRYDKIASIGMYEHIGLKNIPAYMAKVAPS